MNIAFVVTIELDTDEAGVLTDVADNMTEALLDNGFHVVGVNPWERSTTSAVSPTSMANVIQSNL